MKPLFTNGEWALVVSALQRSVIEREIRLKIGEGYQSDRDNIKILNSALEKLARLQHGNCAADVD